tara:strand:- start:413 stop:1282 length:870 start_codon:yes stop_codon:yes gene_type:complete
MKIKILIPIYNDWQSALELIKNINTNIADLQHDFSVILIDDASIDPKPEIKIDLENILSIKIITMKENKGHARCYAAGLKYIFENEDFDYVIPMDGDGEDRPEEIKQFIENLNYHNDKPIVGERVKRSESIFFKTCYFIHKVLTLTFTGKSIKFGNYTCLPKSTVQKMVNEKATWSSFSGALTKIENDRATVPSIRGVRYEGPSQMSFKNLIIHSFSIIGVFKTNVFIRSIFFSLIYLFLIYPNLSITTFIPIILIILFLFMTFKISSRENKSEFDSSLSNILNIESIK